MQYISTEKSARWRWLVNSRLLQWLAAAVVLAATSSMLVAADNAEQPSYAGTTGKVLPPNIVLILADDMGYSDIGCYGGEIATPNLDRLSANGLRFTQMYNTARCWPTRACLMTGYYAQQVNRDPMGKQPAWAAMLPQLLKLAGYRSYHSGKWHLDGNSRASGFDRSYRFEDHNHYFTPKQHFLDDKKVPAAKPGDGYYATTATAQYAIDFLGEHAAGHARKPFFLYLAFTAPHFPLHALPEDIAKYKDRYQVGWEAIRQRRWQRLRDMGIVNCELSALDSEFTPRYWDIKWLDMLGPGEIEHALPWNKLTPEQQRFQATKMAIHAAMIDRMDIEIGRVFDQLRKMNAWDNTLIVFLSDNGADASIMVRGDMHDKSASPGSAESFLCLGPGWANASNTPFRRHKIWVHEGGASTPFIMHWPARIRDGGAIRHAPGHIVDFVPTALELAGVTPPNTWNDNPRPLMSGRSLASAFDRDVTTPRDAIYWSHEGNRAIRVGDWKAVSEKENNGTWELYDLSTDRSESRDLAKQQPERLKRLVDEWTRMDEQFRKDGADGKTRKAALGKRG